MKLGYIRVSKDEQNQDLQVDALKREECDRVFTEKLSGAAKFRPEFEKMLEQVRSGNEVIVWDIDRLGRTTLELIRLIDDWNQKGIRFKSVTQPLIDTTTAHGEFIFPTFCDSLPARAKATHLAYKSRVGGGQVPGAKGWP